MFNTKTQVTAAWQAAKYVPALDGEAANQKPRKTLAKRMIVPRRQTYTHLIFSRTIYAPPRLLSSDEILDNVLRAHDMLCVFAVDWDPGIACVNLTGRIKPGSEECDERQVRWGS